MTTEIIYGINPKDNYPQVQYGTIISSDFPPIHLVQTAYASNYGPDVRYYAAGVDDDGNDYMVAWDTYPDWDGENEEDACDWDSPAAITLV